MILSWMTLSLFFFSVGLYGVLSRKSAVGILISVELMLNAGALNFVVFNRYLAPANVDGQVMAIFVLALASAEVLIGMAILVMLYRRKRSVDVTKLNALRH